MGQVRRDCRVLQSSPRSTEASAAVEELKSDYLLVLPQLLEHERLGLLLTGLLSQDPSLSVCLSCLLLGKTTLLICKCLNNLSKRVWHCNLSHCH